MQPFYAGNKYRTQEESGTIPNLPLGLNSFAKPEMGLQNGVSESVR